MSIPTNENVPSPLSQLVFQRDICQPMQYYTWVEVNVYKARENKFPEQTVLTDRTSLILLSPHCITGKSNKL